MYLVLVSPSYDVGLMQDDENPKHAVCFHEDMPEMSKIT